MHPPVFHTKASLFTHTPLYELCTRCVRTVYFRPAPRSSASPPHAHATKPVHELLLDLVGTLHSGEPRFEHSQLALQHHLIHVLNRLKRGRRAWPSRRWKRRGDAARRRRRPLRLLGPIGDRVRRRTIFVNGVTHRPAAAVRIKPYYLPRMPHRPIGRVAHVLSAGATLPQWTFLNASAESSAGVRPDPQCRRMRAAARIRDARTRQSNAKTRRLWRTRPPFQRPSPIQTL